MWWEKFFVLGLYIYFNEGRYESSSTLTLILKVTSVPTLSIKRTEGMGFNNTSTIDSTFGNSS